MTTVANLFDDLFSAFSRITSPSVVGFASLVSLQLTVMDSVCVRTTPFITVESHYGIFRQLPRATTHKNDESRMKGQQIGSDIFQRNEAATRNKTNWERNKE